VYRLGISSGQKKKRKKKYNSIRSSAEPVGEGDLARCFFGVFGIALIDGKKTMRKKKLNR